MNPIAVIDIGTNTVLLLIASIDRTGHITTTEYLQRVPRLGRGVDSRKMLHPDSMERVAAVLLEYRDIMSRYELASTAVCGTSAVRDAANRDEFARLIKEKTGFVLETLSGQDEALWTYRGAISGVQGISGAAVVDIGGGSTEITSGDLQRITNKVSLDMGSVRLTERLLKHDPPLAAELTEVRNTVRHHLAGLEATFVPPGTPLIGVAGTATTLALFSQGKHQFDINAVSGHIMTHADVRSLASSLARQSSAEIGRMGDFMEGRADIITAGAIILDEVMQHFRFDKIIVSERGVRYGIAIREWERKELRMEN